LRWASTDPARFVIGLIVHAIVLSLACSVSAWPSILLVVAAAFAHAALATVAPKITPRGVTGRLDAFLGVQALHAAVVAVVWALWPDLDGGQGRMPAWLGVVAAAAAVYAFNVDRGSQLVSIVLRGLRDDDQPSGSTSTSGAGRLIGILERWVLVTLILLGQWGGIGFVLAAKSVARFKELEANRHFAEVYLVGTMTSVVTAMATGALLRALADGSPVR
jgi:hypothetical protein